jgi:excisionase family DNA binding protein
MHLIDAIRMAAQQSASPATPQPTQSEAVVDATQASQPEVAMETTKQQNPSAPVPPSPQIPEPVNPAVLGGAGSVVRLELFLSPEQMHQLLRGILQGAHSVMTLREAAQFLRITHDALVRMAEEGQIPAFLVDGRWKFPRQAVEEWVTLQTVARRQNAQQEDEDVA